ncbi:MAG: alpha/beta hydrolase [Betaproteobacteria bacterium CG2_30_59_46]|nr:MAG: alpha/beta hydrolase [Betaproteobacteria bacterium CG2_30_59_46]PIQ12689.1 MAG: alpha/beta hydrolase [Hydrogenophilales bacterium CG18_big_fil_WC_8_21_14_2_50_58_12]PIY01325.1 MAG: alpha/beta hydrolase [Hydrogenophilales bacterium CG_4_10_14_3_um_filter_58_23]PJB05666.1 MAG: alpha/beta hydrolase [Hydrogenophilales bacterium CG_4_9_14_3_um_filter_59_35]
MTSQHFFIDGPSGRLEAAAALTSGECRGIALVAHPHPLYGGTMDNKVVTTLSKTFSRLGLAAFRLNFRGVGQSEGEFDQGIGETGDMLALADHARRELGNLPIVLAGFSFGGYVQTRVLERLEARRLVLVAPAVKRFEVGAVPTDTLVIHGELDEVVPLADVFDWARPQNLPLTVVPGAGHFFHGQLNLLAKIVNNSCRC